MPVSGLAGPVVSIASTDYATCALLATGSVECWGWGELGTLGNGSDGDQSTPIAVSGLTDAISVSAGRNHFCALTGSGKLICWGFNDKEQLGAQTADDHSTAPVESAVGGGATEVVGGGHHTCVLGDGAASCWGANDFGELGATVSALAGYVPGAEYYLEWRSVAHLAAGDGFGCLVSTGGAAECWGGTAPTSSATTRAAATASQ